MAQVLEEKKMAHELPPLPYDYTALEPTIDEKTMHLHHDMHHAAYVKNLNAALDKHPDLYKKTAEDLIRDLNAIPEDIRGPVRNNAGGHVNHTMFWQIMKPKGGGDPTGPIAEAIKKTFGDFKTFQEKFNAAGVGQFGSGWVWLAGDAKGEVKIISTPNQDNPISQGLNPIFGNDVWEHAYYLKYNNRRPEYLQAWWNVVNWDEINKRYRASLKNKEELASCDETLSLATRGADSKVGPSFHEVPNSLLPQSPRQVPMPPDADHAQNKTSGRSESGRRVRGSA